MFVDKRYVVLSVEQAVRLGTCKGPLETITVPEATHGWFSVR